MRTLSTRLFLLALLVAVLVVTGATITVGTKTEGAKAQAESVQEIDFPSDFYDVASQCDGKGFRVYVSKTGSGPAAAPAVVRDPNCR